MPARNWLITGVSSGFGRELATQLLDRGDTVVGTVRRPGSVAAGRPRRLDGLPAFHTARWLTAAVSIRPGM